MQTQGSKPTSKFGAALIFVVWLVVSVELWFWLQGQTLR